MANDDPYSIPELVADLRRLRDQHADERHILSQLRPLMRRAALSKSTWLEPHLYSADEEQGFGVHLLHEEADHTLAILAVSWLPDRGAPPHDHGTWALIAGVEGREVNRFYRRNDDGTRPGYAELKQVGAHDCAEGDVLAMPTGAIHSVWNHGEAVSVSLHVYGKHVNHTTRSQFDPAANTATPYVVTMGG